MGDVLEDLQNYFSQYGELIDSVVLKDASGRPRGFGFVEFADPAAVDVVMNEYSNHQINGSWVEVKRTTPKVASGALRSYQAPAPPTFGYQRPSAGMSAYSPPVRAPSPSPSPRPGGDCKVFIGGLAAECSEGDLLRYFQRYGRIVDLVV